jgi:AAA domain
MGALKERITNGTALAKVQAALEVAGSDTDGADLWVCPVPGVHDSGVPKMTVNYGDSPGVLTITCHSGGCGVLSEILPALDLELADLYDTPVLVSKRSFEYRDLDGRVVRTVHREDFDFGGKRISQSVRVKDVHLLYGLPGLVEAIADGKTAVIVEGEAGADFLNTRTGFAAKYFATTNEGGAGKWKKERGEGYVAQLVEAGAMRVIVIADTDVEGYRHALDIRDSLVAQSIEVEVKCSATADDFSEYIASATPPRGYKDDYEQHHAANFRWPQLVSLDRAELVRRAEICAEHEKLARDTAIQRATSGGGSPREPGGGRRVQIVWANQIAPERPEWLWDRLMPVGALTLLAGREGLGKSHVAFEVAAKATLGTLPGKYEGQPRPVLVVATEDSWAHTNVPRLMAAGADLFKVGQVRVERADTRSETPLDLVLDLDRLEATIVESGAVCMILDPLLSRLSATLDTHKDAEVRQALEPLVAMADRTGCSILGLIHVNKGATADPLNSVMGSRAFTAVPRSVLFVAAHPDVEGCQVFGQVKSNLGPKKEGVETFSIEGMEVKADGGLITTSRLVWGDHDPRSVGTIVAEAQRAARGPTIPQRAAEWVRNFLLDQPERQAPFTDIEEAAAAKGFTRNHLYAARRDHLEGAVTSERARVQGGPATWKLIEVPTRLAVGGSE